MLHLGFYFARHLLFKMVTGFENLNEFFFTAIIEFRAIFLYLAPVKMQNMFNSYIYNFKKHI